MSMTSKSRNPRTDADTIITNVALSVFGVVAIGVVDVEESVRGNSETKSCHV